MAASAIHSREAIYVLQWFFLFQRGISETAGDRFTKLSGKSYGGLE